MKQINKEHHYYFVHHCVANNKTLQIQPMYIT